MMKRFNDTNYAKNLPDNYAKGETSNNYKLLSIGKAALDGLKKDIEDLFNSLDLDNATGKTLDLYGEMYNQPRGLATDEQYRVMIRAKTARNTCKSDLNSILQALAITFSCDPSEMKISNADAACTVKIEDFPLATVTKAGLTTGQAAQLIASVMPLGVQIEFNFEGTFELCATESEMAVDGAKKGLAATEQYMDSTLYPDADGGYLGEFFSGTGNLPI